MTRAVRRQVASLAVGAAGFVLFFARALNPHLFLLRRDAFRLHLPLEEFFASELRAHRLPTWYPFDGLGVSFVGSSVGALLHPLHLLLVAFSPDQAVKWGALIAYPAAAIGTGALAKELGVPRPGRWLAGVGYALSGYLLSMSDNRTYLWSAATIPFVLLAAERLARAPGPRRIAALALALAFAGWSGDVQGLLLQGVAAAAVVASHGLGRAHGWVIVRRAWIGCAAAEICAALLQAPLILAVAAVARESGRAAGLAPAAAMKWSLAPVRLFEIAFGAPFPPRFVDDLGYDFASRYLSHAPGGVWAVSEFGGAALIALALAGLAVRRRLRILAVYGGGGLLALALALGSHTPLYPLLYRTFPLWNAFRYPEKLMPFFLAGLAVLAADGVRALRGPRRGVALAFGAAGFAALALAAAVGPHAIERILAALDASHVSPAPEIRDGVARAVSARLAGSGLVLLVLSAAALLGRYRWLWVAPALQFAQALPLAGWVVSVADVGWLSLRSPLAPAALAGLGGGPGRICQEALNYHFEMPPQESGREVTVRSDILALAPEHSARAGIPNSRAYIPGFSAAFDALCPPERACGTACSRVLGARIGLVDGARFAKLASAAPWLSAIERIPDPDLVLFADPRAHAYAEPIAVRWLPTADAVRNVVLAETATAARDEVFLVGTGAPSPAPAGAVRATRPRPDAIDVDGKLDAPGWVVVRENCSLGWGAEIDGRRVPLARADLTFCAVRMPAGAHRLALRYRPPGWPWAWGAYALGWAALAALAFWNRA